MINYAFDSLPDSKKYKKRRGSLYSCLSFHQAFALPINQNKQQLAHVRDIHTKLHAKARCLNIHQSGRSRCRIFRLMNQSCEV